MIQGLCRRCLAPLSLLALILLQPTGSRAQEILELARERHERPDTTLHDYRSELNSLVSVGFITDPLAPPRLVIASELASEVAWERRGGLQIRMVGQRYVTSFGQHVEAGLDFDEPWFVATTPGDSLRLLGGIELPERAAVHPFAEGAQAFYEYALGDTVTLIAADRQVDLVEIQVTPTRGDEALVVGSVWVDRTTGDVAAMQVRFVGKPLWADDDDPSGQSWANRILSVSATLEQGLWEQRYWLPRHQELELMVRVPFIGNLAIPIVFKSDFGRYDINTGLPIAWVSSDEERAPRPEGDDPEGRGGAEFNVRDRDRGEPGDTVQDPIAVRTGSRWGGWEIIRPPEDTLLAYDGWDRPLETTTTLALPSAEELERRAQELPPDILGAKRFVVQYDRFADMIRYNRVEALGIGLALRWDLPRRPFWSAGGEVSFGVADLGFKGIVDLRYSAPRTQFGLSAYSQLHLGAAPVTSRDRAYGYSLRAFFLGRDDANYYRSSGGALTAGRRWGRVRGVVGVAIEDHTSVSRNTQVAIPGIWQDSVFQTNPPANEGVYYRGDVATTLFMGDWTRPTDRGQVTLGLGGGTGPDSFDYLQPRLDASGRVDFAKHMAVYLLAQAGWTGGTAPIQRQWGIGGLKTVRGFTYGTQLGESFWTARIEVSRRRRIISPVVFADFGWAGTTGNWPSGGPSPIWSAGAGASLLRGFFRADLVFPESGGIWLELYFAGDL